MDPQRSAAIAADCKVRFDHGETDMRQYATDSAQAAARILAVTILADGGLDQAEVNSATRSEAARRLQIVEADFGCVLQDYCQDLLQGADYLDGVALRLAPEVLRLLLNEIRDPGFQQLILQTMHDIVDADGISTEEEMALLSQTAKAWSTSATAAPLAGARTV
jgi:uncharacterized tellurite resistance protein B-like protein